MMPTRCSLLAEAVRRATDRARLGLSLPARRSASRRADRIDERRCPADQTRRDCSQALRASFWLSSAASERSSARCRCSCSGPDLRQLQRTPEARRCGRVIIQPRLQIADDRVQQIMRLEPSRCCIVCDRVERRLRAVHIGDGDRAV